MRTFLIPVVFALVACGSSSRGSSTYIEGGAPQGSPCMVSTDCGAELLCGFPIAAGCAAQGICVSEEVSCTGNGSVVCGCTGDPVQLGCIYGSGYAQQPVVSSTPGCNPSIDAGTD